MVTRSTTVLPEGVTTPMKRGALQNTSSRDQLMSQTASFLL